MGKLIIFCKWLQKQAILATVLFLGLAINVHGQGKDSIFLYNGQVLIGEIKFGQLGEITIDDVDLRVIDVKMYKIKRLTSVRRFKVETQQKKFYFGMIKAGSKPGWIRILSDDEGEIEIDLMDLSILIALEKGFFLRLAGNVSAGFSYSKSSDIGQFNFGSTIQYVAKEFEYQLSLSAIWSIDSLGLSRDRENANLFVAYSFDPTWFAASSFEYQRNLELSLARRYQEMLGGGNKLLIKEHYQLLAVSGISFNQEKSTSGESSGLLLEIPVILRFDFFKYSHPNIQISTSESFYVSLTQKGRVRFDSNTTFSWQLVKDFYLNINPYLNYDNQPSQGSSTFDYGLAVSLSLKF